MEVLKGRLRQLEEDKAGFGTIKGMHEEIKLQEEAVMQIEDSMQSLQKALDLKHQMFHVTNNGQGDILVHHKNQQEAQKIIQDL